MDYKDMKCVMVIDDALPLGFVANTSAIMGITLGKYVEQAVGEHVLDKSANRHLGIIQFPVPMLKGSECLIHEIRNELYKEEFKELVVVDFSDVAQSCKTYEEYIEKFAYIEDKEIHYFGIGICGNKKKINKLTGSLPLL